MFGLVPTTIESEEGMLVVPVLDEVGEPSAANVQEDVMDAVPLHVMMEGSRPTSGPDIIEVEGNVMGSKYTEDLGSDFCVPVSSKKVNLEALAREFGLPDEFEYLLPRDGDSTYIPPPGYITLYAHMLKADFRILPLSFQTKFVRE